MIVLGLAGPDRDPSSLVGKLLLLVGHALALGLSAPGAPTWVRPATEVTGRAV